MGVSMTTTIVCAIFALSFASTTAFAGRGKGFSQTPKHQAKFTELKKLNKKAQLPNLILK